LHIIRDVYAGENVATTSTPTAIHCSECGVPFELSSRRAREYRKPDSHPRCRECRRDTAPSPEAIEQAKRWWLARYTVDELRSWPSL
jgi:hypothetical protein